MFHLDVEEDAAGSRPNADEKSSDGLKPSSKTHRLKGGWGQFEVLICTHRENVGGGFWIVSYDNVECLDDLVLRSK